VLEHAFEEVAGDVCMLLRERQFTVRFLGSARTST
jgi:hypothetical protein